MRKMMLEGINVMLLVLITLATLFSCTLDASAVKNASEREMSSRVARMIDETMAQMMDSSVAEFLTPEQVAELEGVKDSTQGLDGRSIVSRMLEEEQGEEVLSYSYTMITSDDVDEILASARPLVGEEEYGKLVQQVDEIEARAMEAYERASRAMSGEQQKKFYKELQGLVTKAVVLLTAALVYALIPNVMVWGKVSAACVAAVCAGVLASGVMAIVGYKTVDKGEDFDFLTWLKSVGEDAYAEWAIASSVIATSAAAGKSPVITALILAALALYQCFDEGVALFEIAS